MGFLLGVEKYRNLKPVVIPHPNFSSRTLPKSQLPTFVLVLLLVLVVLLLREREG
jgi:hypothetical protein